MGRNKTLTETDTNQGKVMMVNNLTGSTSDSAVFHGRNWKFDFNILCGTSAEVKPGTLGMPGGIKQGNTIVLQELIP